MREPLSPLRRPIGMRTAVVLMTLLALAGCGPADPVAGGPGDDPSRSIDVNSGETELTVVVRAGGGRQTYVLTCEPPDGDHPDPVGACRALTRMEEPFAPVSQGTACTDIYGGPQTARVKGSYRGEPVETEFSRTDGCQVARWDAHAALLVERGGAGGS